MCCRMGALQNTSRLTSMVTGKCVGNQKVGIVAIASPSPYTAPHPLALAMGTTAANLDADGNHYAEGTKYH